MASFNQGTPYIMSFFTKGAAGRAAAGLRHRLAALAAIFLVLGMALPACAAPTMPTLQALLLPAAPASAASAAAPASAPSPASQADIVKSLNVVINTLDNTRQRQALVSQLKKLRQATEHAVPVAPSEPNPGLLGAIAAGFASIEKQARGGDTPLSYWEGRLRAAGNELYTIVSGHGALPPARIALDFLSMLAIWGATAAALIFLQHKLRSYYSLTIELRPDPSTPELLWFAVRRVAPWIIAFLVALYLSRSMAPSLGHSVALVCAYAIVSGAVFSAICLIMFSLFGSGHRRVAVRLLLRHARRLLFAIGVFGALGDAAINYNVSQELGSNLSALIATAANMTAAILTGYFALAFRRPVAHLIHNRSYDNRQNHKTSTETFDIIGGLWHVPMLLLAGASVIATLAGLGSSGSILQQAIGCSVLMVVALFLTAVVRRLTRPRSAVKRRRRRQSAYVGRLIGFCGTLATLFIWLAFLELSARFWGYSLLIFAQESASGRGISNAVTSIGVAVFVAWLLWIVLDTAIQEALNPSGHRGKMRGVPSTRARTMLPLVRNVVFVTILVVATIVILANLGLNVTPLLAGAGVVGLAFGFGAQSLVQDLITGLFIIIEDTISVGDSIEVEGGHAGIVESLTIRTVRLRDGQGAVHAIPFSQIKTVKNLSRDFAYAVFDVRVPFSADVDEVTRLIREVGADLAADFRHRRDMLGAIEVWGLDRFDQNWMVIKGQIKTRPLQQWSIARAFNVRLKRKMDDAGIEIPVPRMSVHVEQRSSGDAADRPAQPRVVAVSSIPAMPAAAPEQPGPAPQATQDTSPVPAQIPTAGPASS